MSRIQQIIYFGLLIGILGYFFLKNSPLFN